jgi:SAM-dependent methyltransferase
MANKQIKTNLIQAYNRQAEQRNKGGIQDWKVVERAYFLSLLQQQNKQSLLEIGTGHGRDSLFFQEQGFKVTGIDISHAMASLCRKKGIPAFVMDMVELGFENNSFDAVYALNSFLHLPKSEFSKTLESVCNVLKPAGLLCLGMYGGFDFEGIWDQDTYTPKRFFSFHSDRNLKTILDGTFEIVYFRHISLGEDNRPFQSTILKNRVS